MKVFSSLSILIIFVLQVFINSLSTDLFKRDAEKKLKTKSHLSPQVQTFSPVVIMDIHQLKSDTCIEAPVVVGKN